MEVCPQILCFSHQLFRSGLFILILYLSVRTNNASMSLEFKKELIEISNREGLFLSQHFTIYNQYHSTALIVLDYSKANLLITLEKLAVKQSEIKSLFLREILEVSVFASHVPDPAYPCIHAIQIYFSNIDPIPSLSDLLSPSSLLLALQRDL